MKFQETEQALTPEDIWDFENALGIVLPAAFRQHYLLYNGGFHPFQYLKGVKNIFSVNSFIPIKYGANPIEKGLKNYNASGIFFGKRIPFAVDDGGNPFFICCGETGYGRIEIARADFLFEDPIDFVLVQETFEIFLDSFLEAV